MQRYRICVQGALAQAWADSLGGLAISVREQPAQPPITELRGRLADQSALHGVLNTLFLLELPVLLVELEPDSDPFGSRRRDASDDS